MKQIISSIKIYLFIAFFNTYCDKVAGQATGDTKEDFLYGEYYIVQSMYQEALPFYLSSLTSNPENSNINYRIGLCYSKIIGEQQNALPYLKKAVLNIDKNYIEGRYNNPTAPGDSWLLLGDAYHRINELTNASRAYNKYLELIGDSDKEKSLIVKKKIEGLGISYDFQRTESHIKMINMGGLINSRFSDYNPVLSGDQKTMVYTQYWDSYDRIMITYKTDNKWSVPVEINKQVGSQGDCYTSALSFKGDELFLISHEDENYNIYYSRFLDSNWTKMVTIGDNINTKHQESSVCISADGNYLYFSSNRPGGEGGFDIYIAEKEGNHWINIRNLGNIINTKKNEEGPFITCDGTFLYFSSDGHETIGNMDILYSELGAEGNWKIPKNIGYPINTTNDELFYFYFKNTQTGYLSRDLTEGLGKNDIYQVVNENVQYLTEGAFQIVNIVESKLNTRDDAIYTSQRTIDSSDSPIVIVSIDSSSLKNADNITENNIDVSTKPAVNIGEIPVYTIQIFALKLPKKVTEVNIAPLVVSACDDGLYRYTTGEYRGWSAALLHLEQIRANGYPDAFIRNVDSISNYSISKQ